MADKTKKKIARVVLGIVIVMFLFALLVSFARAGEQKSQKIGKRSVAEELKGESPGKYVAAIQLGTSCQDVKPENGGGEVHLLVRLAWDGKVAIAERQLIHRNGDIVRGIYEKMLMPREGLAQVLEVDSSQFDESEVCLTGLYQVWFWPTARSR